LLFFFPFFSLCDIVLWAKVFLDQLGSDKTRALPLKDKFRSWWIGTLPPTTTIDWVCLFA
jgi:hypothetical protein